MICMSLDGRGRLLRGPVSGKRSDAAAAGAPSRSFRFGFSGSVAGQGKVFSEALGIGRPQPLAQRGGTVIAAMAAVLADGFRDPACGWASVVVLMNAHPGTWAANAARCTRVSGVNTTGP